ncbi:MAG TPA: DUF3810 domain-containing protein [Flavihumibacter sp.]|jgi:hypothetical protein
MMQERMVQRYRYTGLFILVAIALLIKVLAVFPELIERYYAAGIYPFISRVQRWLFGWIPFSVGDLLYALLTLWLIRQLVKLIGAIRRKQVGRDWLLRTGVKIMKIWLWVYIVFNLLWGLNYNRLGIARQAAIHPTAYSTEELDSLVSLLQQRIEANYEASLGERKAIHQHKNLFGTAFRAYQQPQSGAVFLRYGGQSVKSSFYGFLGNYLGFTGYYNPFTGEAQVNTSVPIFVQPFTTCHEIGHQLGYAKENEANFAGFLTASRSENAAFRYSAYFDVYLYAIRDLYQRDSTRAQYRHDQLLQGAKLDLAELRRFNQEHVGLLEPLFRTLYAQYLRVNQQPAGLMSYNQVVALLIAYGRKYGFNNL